MEKEIIFNDITLRVVGEYTAEEAGCMYDDDMSGLPLSGSSFDCCEIYVADSEINIYNLFSFKDIDKIGCIVIDGVEC